MDLKAALLSMDPLDDDHWTTDGAPRIEVLKTMTGARELTRENVINFAPDFNRESSKKPNILLMNKSMEAQVDAEEEGQGREEVLTAEENIDLAPEDFPGSDLSPFFWAAVSALEEIPFNPKSYNDAVGKMDTNEISLLVVEIDKHRDQVDRSIVELTQHTKILKMVKVQTNHRLLRVSPEMSNQEAIRNVINNANEQRKARAMDRSLIVKYIGEGNLDPRSVLDRAMSRKNKRGGERPQFKPKTG